MSGFHGAFATGVACQQGTLTLLDTWFRPPLWDLLVLQLLRPDSSNLPCLYATFHLGIPFGTFSILLTRFIFSLNMYMQAVLTYYFENTKNVYFLQCDYILFLSHPTLQLTLRDFPCGSKRLPKELEHQTYLVCSYILKYKERFVKYEYYRNIFLRIHKQIKPEILCYK